MSGFLSMLAGTHHKPSLEGIGVSPNPEHVWQISDFVGMQTIRVLHVHMRCVNVVLEARVGSHTIEVDLLDHLRCARTCANPSHSICFDVPHHFVCHLGSQVKRMRAGCLDVMSTRVAVPHQIQHPGKCCVNSFTNVVIFILLTSQGKSFGPGLTFTGRRIFERIRILDSQLRRLPLATASGIVALAASAFGAAFRAAFCAAAAFTGGAFAGTAFAGSFARAADSASVSAATTAATAAFPGLCVVGAAIGALAGGCDARHDDAGRCDRERDTQQWRKDKLCTSPEIVQGVRKGPPCACSKWCTW